MRLVAAVSALLAGQWAVACSCAPPPDPKKALEQAAAVCLAEVVKVEGAGQGRVVTLKVLTW